MKCMALVSGQGYYAEFSFSAWDCFLPPCQPGAAPGTHWHSSGWKHPYFKHFPLWKGTSQILFLGRKKKKRRQAFFLEVSSAIWLPLPPPPASTQGLSLFPCQYTQQHSVPLNPGHASPFTGPKVPGWQRNPMRLAPPVSLLPFIYLYDQTLLHLESPGSQRCLVNKKKSPWAFKNSLKDLEICKGYDPEVAVIDI